MKRRNDEVYGTLMYWAYRYDPGVVPILERFLLGWNFVPVQRKSALFFLIRRTVLQGLDMLIRYQETGRAATRSIADDRLRYARMLATPFTREPAFHALAEMADWMIREAALPPLRIRL